MKRGGAGVALLWLVWASVAGVAQETNPWPEPGSLDLSMEVDAAMQSFLMHPRLQGSLPDISKARTIVQLLFAEESGGFTYDADLTLAPSDAFIERRGNCLTFAMLFTTLARAVGLETQFHELRTAPGWNRSGDLIVETGHVNVVVRSGRRHFVVEWLDFYRDLSHLRSKAVSDAKIRSDFFNNLAVQAMGAKQLDIAKPYLEHAQLLDPKNPGVWQNTGVLWMHLGRADEAERAFLRGAEVASSQSSLYFLLSKLYAQQGKSDLAQRYGRMGERYARKNPFYHYQLAMESFDEASYRQARNHLERAIDLLPEYHLFHFLKARCLLKSGALKAGLAELELAFSLTQSPSIRAQYQRHLDAWTPPPPDRANGG